MLPMPSSDRFSAPEIEPLRDLIGDELIEVSDLNVRWQYDVNRLSNMRRLGKGLPYIKLPTGGIRYRLSEIVAAETLGRAEVISLDAAALVIWSCLTVPIADRALMIGQLEKAFGET